eukprot:6179887-Pleurochrysis_carterae.AAC.6
MMITQTTSTKSVVMEAAMVTATATCRWCTDSAAVVHELAGLARAAAPLPAALRRVDGDDCHALLRLERAHVAHADSRIAPVAFVVEANSARQAVKVDFLTHRVKDRAVARVRRESGGRQHARGEPYRGDGVVLERAHACARQLGRIVCGAEVVLRMHSTSGSARAAARECEVEACAKANGTLAACWFRTAV